MEKLRCPTCLTMLDGGEQRCPACHTRLRKRGRPIVLGESTRITSRPLFPFERDMRARVEASNAAGHSWHAPHISLVARATAREPDAPEAEPEIPEALLAFDVTRPPTPASAPVDIDLTTEPDDIHEIFEALHRKARAEPDEPAAPDPLAALSNSPSPASSSRSRRRWTLARRPRSDAEDS